MKLINWKGYRMIKVTYQDSFKSSYYELIADSRLQKFERIKFEAYYENHLESKLGYSLWDILCGDYEKLLEIKTKLGTKYRKDTHIKGLFNFDKTKNVKISKLQPKIATFMQEELEIDTCYYCNIEFINKFKSSNGEYKNGFTLDHFIDKGNYPYLALSLYNLIPSCYTCNSKLKHSSEINNLSPSSSRFNFDFKVKFKTFMKNENLQIDNENDFELILKESFSNEYQDYIKIFDLNGRYEYHKYKVIEMIRKRRKYPDSRIKELAKLTEKTEEEVKQDLFGEYIFEDDILHKRPFSKLIRDISKELDLS